MTRKDNEQVPTVRMRGINRQEKGSKLRKTVEAFSGNSKLEVYKLGKQWIEAT